MVSIFRVLNLLRSFANRGIGAYSENKNGIRYNPSNATGLTSAFDQTGIVQIFPQSAMESVQSSQEFSDQAELDWVSTLYD